MYAPIRRSSTPTMPITLLILFKIPTRDTFQDALASINPKRRILL